MSTGISNVAAGFTFEGASKAARTLQEISQMQRELQAEMASTSKTTIDHTFTAEIAGATDSGSALRHAAEGERLAGYIGLGTTAVSLGATGVGIAGKSPFGNDDELNDAEDFQGALKNPESRDIVSAEEGQAHQLTDEEQARDQDCIQTWKGSADRDADVRNFNGARKELNRRALNSIKDEDTRQTILSNIEKRLTELKARKSGKIAEGANTAVQLMNNVNNTGSSLAHANGETAQAIDEQASQQERAQSEALSTLQRQQDDLRSSYQSQADSQSQSALSLLDQPGSYQQIAG